MILLACCWLDARSNGGRTVIILHIRTSSSSATATFNITFIIVVSVFAVLQTTRNDGRFVIAARVGTF